METQDFLREFYGNYDEGDKGTVLLSHLPLDVYFNNFLRNSSQSADLPNGQSFFV